MVNTNQVDTPARFQTVREILAALLPYTPQAPKDSQIVLQAQALLLFLAQTPQAQAEGLTEDLFRQALALNPATALVCYGYAIWLRSQGRAREALALLSTVPSDKRFLDLYFPEYVTTLHGQVAGYRLEDGQSVADLRPAAPGQLALAGRVQGAILAVAEAWAGEAAASGLGPGSLVALTPAVVANLVDFLADPCPGEAAALGQVLVGDDQNESRYRRLVRPLGLGDLIRAWLSRRGWRPWPAYEASCDWLEGGIALSRPWLRPVLRTRRAFALLRDWRKSC